MKIGDKVVANERMLEAREIDEKFYPLPGTEGEIVGIDLINANNGVIMVQWAKGSTIKDDRWWCPVWTVDVKEDNNV